MASVLPGIRAADPKNYANDFDRTWYINFGDSLIMTMIFGILNPIIGAVTAYVVRRIKLNQVKKCKIQKQAKLIYKKPLFNLG